MFFVEMLSAIELVVFTSLRCKEVFVQQFLFSTIYPEGNFTAFSSYSQGIQRNTKNAEVSHFQSLLAMQGSVSEEGRKMMEEVEREQSFEELAVLRRLVMTHIKTERDLAEVNNNNNSNNSVM